MGDESATFENPMADDLESMPPSPCANIPAASVPKTKKVQDFGSEDIGLRTVDSNGGEASIKDAIKTFKRFDEDNGGTLDLEEFGGVLRSLGRANSEAAVLGVMSQMVDMTGSHSQGAQIVEVTLQMFVNWFTENLDEPDEVVQKKGGKKKASNLGKKMMKPAKALKRKIIGGGMGGGAGGAIAPESMFVIDSRGNDEARRKAEAITQAIPTTA